MLKKLAVFFSLIAAAILFWFAFAFWTGLYSLYSVPPCARFPDGVTLVVARDEGEPLFNSPKYRIEPKKPEPPQTGIGFISTARTTRPFDQRTILELPYIEWAFEKSLEPE